MSTISWLYDESGVRGKEWNPTLGCSPKSIGCMHCYAAALAHRGMCEEHRGLTTLKKRRNDAGKLVGLPVYNGTVNLHPDRLEKPLHWHKPRRIFVNSMSDLFHREVPFEFIAAVFGVMSACQQHTFIVLTKWPERAVEFFAWLNGEGALSDGSAAGDCVTYATQQAGTMPIQIIAGSGTPWPLPNVHLGVSAENWPMFLERVPRLMQCDAAVRLVSMEPLLGPMGDLRPWLPHAFNREPHCDWCEDCVGDGPRERWTQSRPDNHGPFLDWVVPGLESGPGARRGDLEWLDHIVEQVSGRAALFVKQLGSNPHRGGYRLALRDGKGEDLSEWSDEHLRVRELPRGPS